MAQAVLLLVALIVVGGCVIQQQRTIRHDWQALNRVA